MNVLYTCDNNYVWLMGVSTISLFESNKHIKNLTVYLLGDGISDENKKELENIAERYSRNIITIDIPQFNIPESLVSARWPLSAFTRLYSPQLLPDEVDRILYLDCDTIVSGDIETLETLHFEGKTVLGVKDCISGIYKRNIGLKKDSIYINAGVLLFNVSALRSEDINAQIDIYMRKYEKFINYADQDILNGIFASKIGELDARYNIMTIDVVHSYREILKIRRPTSFYTEREFYNARECPAIIHYTTNMLVIRPWYINTNHPLANEFKKYMKISPWKEKTLPKMVFKTGESKIIFIINKLPKTIAYWFLGLIHSEFKPRFIYLKARIGGRK